MKHVAIIPARGGSKRIPRKNLAPIGGKPILAHVIQAALRSNVFEQIVVSSDDDEILTVSQQAGALPYKRPAALADDLTHVGPVVEDTIAALKIQANSICLLFATALLLHARHLHQALELLQDGQVASVLSITEFDSPIQRAYEINDSGEIQMALPEYFNWRSQDLPKRYRDAGMFSWWKTSPTGQQRRGLLIPKTESVDIDTPEDLLLAEALFAFHASRREST